MKKILTITLTVALLAVSGCHKKLWNEIDELKLQEQELAARIAALEAWQTTVNSNITALQGLVNALQQHRYISTVSSFTTPAPGGYTITFDDNLTPNPITINNGEKGEDGAPAPQIGVKQDPDDGVYYWTLNGEWLYKPGTTDRIPVIGAPGVLPQLRIENGFWEVSYDNGTTWISTGVAATGATGANGITPQLRINAGNWEVSYDNGATWTSLGVPATGADGADGVTPQLRINAGFWEVSYDNGVTWTSTGVAATGATGANGITPQLRINAGYWEVSYDNGATWTSLDVLATGAPGTPGTNGNDGATPKVAIGADNHWYVCPTGTCSTATIDAANGWTDTGVQATGATGAQGIQGEQGDAIFAENGVDNSHSDYVEFTLADGTTKIRLPKYKELGISFTAPALFAAGETKSVLFTLVGNVAFVKVLDVPQDWTVTVTKTADAGTFTITAPNPISASNETGEAVILVSDNADRTIVRVLPLSTTPPTLSVSTATVDATAAAGTYAITVTSNMAWTATVDAAGTWCPVTPASATGNGTVTVSVSENPTVASRAATVTITAGSLNQAVVVTQEAPLPTTLCAQCCWDGTASTWVDCYVTTNAYPFDNNTTNTQVVWSGNGVTYYDGARSDRNGRANTAAISSTGMSAVQLCKDLGTGWYLPAYEELVNMSTGSSKLPLNGLSGANLMTVPDDYYWSSSEYYDNGGRGSGSITAYQNGAVIVYTNGNLNGTGKTSNHYVRCAWRN
jgi:hypothetical protein